MLENSDSSPVQIAALSDLERQRKAELEATVSAGFQTFVEVGKALREIKDSNLWRDGYSSWSDYLQRRWQMSSSRARQLWLAADTQTQIESSGVTTVTLPNEHVARELRKFDETLRPTIARIAAARAKADKVELSSKYINSTGKVIEEAAMTGHVDTGSGEASAFDAAITAEEYEAMQRQKQHIVESVERKLKKTKRERLVRNQEGMVKAVLKDGCMVICLPEQMVEQFASGDTVYITIDREVKSDGTDHLCD